VKPANFKNDSSSVDLQPPEGTDNRAIILQSRGNSSAMKEMTTESYNETANRNTLTIEGELCRDTAQCTTSSWCTSTRVCPSPLNRGGTASQAGDEVWSLMK
jgi:hypothetical protein